METSDTAYLLLVLAAPVSGSWFLLWLGLLACPTFIRRPPLTRIDCFAPHGPRSGFKLPELGLFSGIAGRSPSSGGRPS